MLYPMYLSMLCRFNTTLRSMSPPNATNHKYKSITACSAVMILRLIPSRVSWGDKLCLGMLCK
jgi:hypothetical protein